MATSISGKIERDGVTTEFSFDARNGSWSQWGPATREQLGERVVYLDAMAKGLTDESDYYNQEDEV